MSRFLLMIGVVATLGCGDRARGDQPLANLQLGTARVLGRTDSLTRDKKPIDGKLRNDSKGPLVLEIAPPTRETCIPSLEKVKLDATANGAAMKLEVAGGKRRALKIGPHDSDLVDETCDPIRFVVERGDVTPDADGTVTFRVTDGATTIELAWEGLLATRALELVGHDATLEVGETIVVQTTPTTDELTTGKGSATVCMVPGPDGAACVAKPNAAMCTDAKLTGTRFEFTVPDGWSCATSGKLWVAGVDAHAHPKTCDAKLKACRTEITSAFGQLDVRIVK